MEPGQSDQPVAGFRRNCLVPCSGPDCTCSVVLTKLCVIIHNFAYQPFDQLLADRTVLAARRANRATMKRPGDGDDWRLIDDPTEEEFAAVKAHANPEQRELIEVLCAAIAPVLKELIEPLRGEHRGAREPTSRSVSRRVEGGPALRHRLDGDARRQRLAREPGDDAASGSRSREAREGRKVISFRGPHEI
jgi:hypothetical protein